MWSNKKNYINLIYTIILSIIIHSIIGIMIYILFIKKEKIVYTVNNLNSINTSEIIPVNTNTSQNNSNHNSFSTKPTKIDNTQRQVKTKHALAPTNTSQNNSNQLKNLLNTLIDMKHPIENITKKQYYNVVQKDNQHAFIQDSDINIYKNMIIKAIQNKFYNASNYIGKKCDVHIQLNPNGTLLSITEISGDPTLCQAAIIAIKSAKFPKPPNIHVYKIFENVILNFSPQ